MANFDSLGLNYFWQCQVRLSVGYVRVALNF